MSFNKIIVTFFLVFLFSQSAFSQNSSGGYANLALGLTVPDAANTRPHGLSGIMGGSSLTDKFSLGGYHLISSNEDGPNNGKFSFTLTGLETRLLIQTGEKNVFVALRAGIAKVNSVDSGTPIIFSPYHYGIVSGYSFKVFSMMSMGIEGSYLSVSSSETTNGGSTLSLKSFHTISFLATIGLLL